MTLAPTISTSGLQPHTIMARPSTDHSKSAQARAMRSCLGLPQATNAAFAPQTSGLLALRDPSSVTSTEPSPVPVTVSASPTYVHEGSSATYTFSTSPAPSQTIYVSYSKSGTATRGDDYTLRVGSPVKIPAGQSSATVTLNALEDSDPGPGATEANQTAIMTLKA